MLTGNGHCAFYDMLAALHFSGCLLRAFYGNSIAQI